MLTDSNYHRRTAHFAVTLLIGQILIEECGMNEQQAGATINKWLRDGLLYVEDYTDPKTRKSTSGVLVNDSKRPS